MNNNIKKITKILRSRYPVVKTQLHHGTPFQLLIATILSAQCTDGQVNRATPKLFKNYPDAASLSTASIKTIEGLIFSTGFYRNKAKNIKACSRALLDKHRGTVPDRLEELVKLPGVGRKTANVVLSTSFGHQTIVVDTHVSRISQRLGLTPKNNPVGIEFDLMEKLNKPDWNDFSLWLIYFGREICSARNPLCGSCPLYNLCTWSNKERFIRP